MSKENQTRIVVRIAFIILAITILWIGKEVINIWTDVQHQRTEKQKVLNELAQRIGVEPDWKAVRDYLYCDTLKPGMSQVQVEHILDKIGPYFEVPYNSGGDYKEVDFKNAYIAHALSPFKLSFSDGRLIDWGRGESNFGPRSKCE